MSRRRDRNPWQSSAGSMWSDPAGKRLYGPLWPLLGEVCSLVPHTDLGGVATLVALCSDNGDVEDLCSRIARPRPGTRESPRQRMARWMPTDRPVGELAVDHHLLGWVGGDRGRRLWAIVGLVWGLERDEVIAANEELLGLGARPARLPCSAVTELACTTPSRIPSLLVREEPLDVVAASYARSLGMAVNGGIDVIVPAALGATAAALAAEPLEGIAATALLIRARSHPGVTPEALVTMCRPGSAAAGLAAILARLWATSLRHEPAAAPAPAPAP